MAFVSVPVRVTPEDLEHLREMLQEDGVAYHAPRCYKCEGELQGGDVLDHFWPFHSEKNLCTTCEEKGKPC